MTKVITKKSAEIKILSPTGIIEGGFTIHSDDRTKSGAIILEDKNGELIKVHPDRIIDDISGDSIIVYGQNKAFAPCPQCNQLIEPTNAIFNCPTHGIFDAQKSDKIKTNSKIVPVRPPVSKSSTKYVNFDKLSRMGEIWIKNDINFDHKHVEVTTCCMIFEEQKRYITFNIYNGAYGKKNKKPPFEDVLAGKNTGYVIKDIKLLRNKYAAKGYKKYKRIRK